MNMRLSGRILIIIVTVIVAVSALFCIIGLATKGWAGGTLGLFCNVCPTAPAALSVISFILLIITIVAFALLMFGILQGVLQIIPFALLFVATIFLLSTFASYFTAAVGYSYNLMVVAHFFSYVALAIAAYWYGQTEATAASTG